MINVLIKLDKPEIYNFFPFFQLLKITNSCAYLPHRPSPPESPAVATVHCAVVTVLH